MYPSSARLLVAALDDPPFVPSRNSEVERNVADWDVLASDMSTRYGLSLQALAPAWRAEQEQYTFRQAWQGLVPESAGIGVEFCGTSISCRANSSARLTAQRLAENPHFVFGDASRRGYGLCDFSPAGLTTTLRVLDDATSPDAQVETLARFAVAAGRPVIERA